MTTTAPLPGQAGPTPEFALRDPLQRSSTESAVGDTVGPQAQAVAQGEGADLPRNLLRGDNLLQAQEAEDGADADGLSSEEEAEVRELKKTDAEVRRHEQAHARVGGRYAGQPQYEFEAGPDGKRYAVSGHVTIDVAPVPGEPKETIEKMETVRRAAMAPADPSAQDHAVAARAQREKLKAQQELQAERQQEREHALNPEARPAPGAATVTAPDRPEADRKAGSASAGLVNAVI